MHDGDAEYGGASCWVESSGGAASPWSRPPLPGRMRAVQTGLRQSLLTQLASAAASTEHGTVRLITRRQAEWVSLALVDPGFRMTKEQISRLFEEFAQVDASTARRFGGTGLGLALSRRFCRMIGGDIDIESQPGTNSTFTTRMPGVALWLAGSELGVYGRCRSSAL